MNTTTSTTTTDALTAARATHAAAVDRRTGLQARLSKAHAAMTEATEARRRLVDDIANGGTPTPAAASKIDAAIRDAAAGGALLQDALPAHDAAVAAASEAAAVASAAVDYEQFQARIQNRIAAAARIDAAVAELDAANQAYQAAGDELRHNWPARTAILMHETEWFNERRSVAWRLPASLQTAIVQCGSVNVLPSLAEREYATWLNRLPTALRSAA